MLKLLNWGLWHSLGIVPSTDHILVGHIEKEIHAFVAQHRLLKPHFVNRSHLHNSKLISVPSSHLVGELTTLSLWWCWWGGALSWCILCWPWHPCSLLHQQLKEEPPPQLDAVDHFTNEDWSQEEQATLVCWWMIGSTSCYGGGTTPLPRGTSPNAPICLVLAMHCSSAASQAASRWVFSSMATIAIDHCSSMRYGTSSPWPYPSCNADSAVGPILWIYHLMCRQQLQYLPQENHVITVAAATGMMGSIGNDHLWHGLTYIRLARPDYVCISGQLVDPSGRNMSIIDRIHHDCILSCCRWEKRYRREQEGIGRCNASSYVESYIVLRQNWGKKVRFPTVLCRILAGSLQRMWCCGGISAEMVVGYLLSF